MNWLKMGKRPTIENTNRDRPPCKDCKSRVVGCHSKCMKYLNWTLEREAYREEQLKKRLITDDVYDFRNPSAMKRRNDNARTSKRRK